MIRQNKNKLKRPLALLLVCVLLAGVAIPAHALLTETPDASGSPTVRVISTLTDGGQYLEVGLNIDSKEDGKFQSVGALLKYDPDMLTPVQWDEPATEINVPVSSEAAKTWSEAELLPAKGADELNGKVAAAAKSEASGFLYLSAESARVKNGFMQPLPTEAGDKTTLPTLSETTTQGLPISAIAKAETPSQQAVVVRFKVNEKPPAEAGGDITEAAPQPELYSLAELAAALDIVDPTADEATTLSFPLADKSGLTYIADNTSVSSAGQTTPANLEFLWVQEGVTVNSGTGGVASPENFASIVFYDWDDTVLGSVVVPKGDATEQVKAFEKSLAATDDEKAALSNEDKTELWADLPDKPLTNKRGYSFEGVWIDYNSETLTHYGSKVQGNMIYKPSTAEEGVIDFTNVQSDLLVKACYGANNELYQGGGAFEYYTTEIISNERVAGNVFLIQIKVKRENTVDGKVVGVPRLGEPAVRIRMASGDLELPQLVTMPNKDEYIIEAVPSTLVDNFRYVVIDTYQNRNWPNIAVKSNEFRQERGGVENNLIENNTWSDSGTVIGSGFYYEGTVAMINNLVMPGGSISDINKLLLDEFGLNYKMVSTIPPIDAIKVTQARQYIQNAFNQLNGISSDSPTKPNYQHLSYKQIQYAIASEGALLSE